MTDSVDPTVQAWMRQGYAETTPDQDDLQRELYDTKPEPDWHAVWSINFLSRLVRLFQARYQGPQVVRTSDSQAIYCDLRARLLHVLPLAGLRQEHDLAVRAFPEQIADLDQGGLEQRGDDRQRLIDWLCDHCQQRGLMRYREALTGYFAEIDRRIDAIHFETWAANFPERKHVPLPPLGQSMAQYIERAREEIEGRRALREEWERQPAGLRALSPEVAEFTNYSPRQLRIGAARVRLRRLAALVMTKVEYEHLCEHPADREIYIQTRQALLDDLQAAGLDDGFRWASEAIPERLAELITRERIWDYDGVIRLDDELFRLVVDEKLTRLVDLLMTHVFAHDGIDSIIREIDQATQQANELEESRRLAVMESPPGQPLNRATHPSPDGAPSVAGEPALKKKRQPRVRVMTQFAARAYWVLHDNPQPPQVKERAPSALELRDFIVLIGHDKVSEKSLRAHMKRDPEVGYPPRRQPPSDTDDNMVRVLERRFRIAEDNSPRGS